MKTTLKWIENHLDLGNISFGNKLQLVVDIVNKIGMEMDDVRLCNMLIVGEIIHVEQLPKTQLYKCIVNIKDIYKETYYDISTKLFGKLQEEYIIFTKLDNIKIGMKTSFIPYDNYSPDGMMISKRNMMGYLSEGMFYTNTEKALEYDEVKILNIDAILNIATNTNRTDLKNVRGIARDISNKTGILKPLLYDDIIPNVKSIMYALNIENGLNFMNLDADLQYEGEHTIKGYINSINKTLNTNNDINVITNTINTNKEIFLSHSLFFKMTSLDISLYQMTSILEKAGFKAYILRQKSDNINIVHDNFGINVIAPIWRTDIDNEMYIIHEIVRLHGLNHIYQPKASIKNVVYNNPYNDIKTILCAHGFVELYNFPFIDQSIYDNSVIIKNLSSNNIMRDTLLFSLLKSADFAFSHNEVNVKLYEIGKVYPSEEERIGILMSGYEIANIMHKKHQITSIHMQNILALLSLKQDKCSNINCNEKIHSWHKIKDIDIYGCYCNFILKSKYILGRDEKIYYYYESNIKKIKYINNFTDSMKKNYTNINLTSSNFIIWADIKQILSKYEHSLVDSGFFKDKYTLTISIAYKDDNELQIIKELLKNWL